VETHEKYIKNRESFSNREVLKSALDTDYLQSLTKIVKSIISDAYAKQKFLIRLYPRKSIPGGWAIQVVR
jgi:hypothetical protein